MRTRDMLISSEPGSGPSHRIVICELWAPSILGKGVHEPARAPSSPTKASPIDAAAHHRGSAAQGAGPPPKLGRLRNLSFRTGWLPPPEGKTTWHGMLARVGPL